MSSPSVPSSALIPQAYLEPVVFTANVATLSANQSGHTMVVPAPGANAVLNLPVPAAGLNYRIMSNATLANTVVITPNTGTFYGVLWGNNAGVIVPVGCANKATITMTALSLKGDYIDLFSDGTSWFVRGFGQAVSFN